MKILKQAILQVHLQVFYWLPFSVPIIENIEITEYGWRINEEGKAVPVWFTGPQLPPKIDKKNNVKSVKGDALLPPTTRLCLHTMTEESDDLGEGNSVVTEDLETINYIETENVANTNYMFLEMTLVVKMDMFLILIMKMKMFPILIMKIIFK